MVNWVDVDERAFILFDTLINTYPETCTKAQLTNLIWVDTVVSDWSLSKLISDIRKVFKQAGYQGPLFQTVHGKGYRLAVELTMQLHGKSGDISLPTTNTNLKFTNNKRLIFGGISLAAALGVLFYIYKYSLAESIVTQEPNNAIARILWVDDNPSNNAKERLYFEKKSIAVYPVISSDEAKRLLSIYQYQIVISDMGRQEDKLAGIHLLEYMRANDITTPFVLYTWHSTPRLINEISELGGQSVAIDSKSLYEAVEKHLVD